MIKLPFTQIVSIAAQTSVAVAVIVLGLSQEVKAEEYRSQKTIQISQDPFNSIEQHSTEGDRAKDNNIAQSRRRRRRQRRTRNRNSRIQGYYGGFSGGIGFLDGELQDTAENLSDPEYNNAFLGSIFGGVKFSKYISADLEFILGLGGVNADDLEDEAAAANEITPNTFIDDLNVDGDYSAFGLYLNPRFELPLGRRERLNLYLSPGVGISQTNINVNFSGFDQFSETDRTGDFDASQLGISFQIKGGASYAIKQNIVVFAQARYVNFPTEDELNPESVTTDIDSLDLFSTELGLSFKF